MGGSASEGVVCTRVYGLWHALRGVVCSLHYEVWSTLGGVVYTRGCGLY